MAHKLFKQHYKIGHIVHIRDGDLLIGSPYISDLITVGMDGKIKKHNDSLVNDDLKRYVSEISADPERAAELLAAPDTFEKSIKVYSCQGSEIIEDYCEEFGWPHTTHKGELMYANTHFLDKKDAIKCGQREALSGFTMMKRRVKDLEKNLAETREIMEKYWDDYAKLNVTF